MENQNLWYLENIDVTNILCPTKIDNAHDHLEHKTYKRGEYVYMPDEASDKMYFISEGRVKVGSMSENGKEITKAILNKGEVFGELAVIGEDKRRDFAYTMEETTVCVIATKDIKSLLKEHSGLNLFLMKILGSRVLEMESRLESLVFKDSRSRIIEYLLEMVEKNGQRAGYEWIVRKFITHQEIANLTATSRQTVTTILNELRANNILTFDRKRLLVRDLEALKAEALVVTGY